VKLIFRGFSPITTGLGPVSGGYLPRRRRGLWICHLCHGGIHDLIPDEKDLGSSYNTRELLLAHEGVRKHVDWVRKVK
jgi:hypothetical protein